MEKVKSVSMLQTGFVFLQLVLMHKMCHAQTSTEDLDSPLPDSTEDLYSRLPDSTEDLDSPFPDINQMAAGIQQLTDAVKHLNESMERVEYYLERATAFRTYTNVAAWKNATQSSSYHSNGDAYNAVDNNLDSDFHHWSCTHTRGDESVRAWWQVDLSQEYPVYMVVITNRKTLGERLHDFQVLISVSDPLFHTSTLCYTFSGAAQSGVTRNLPCTNAPINGRYVRVLNGPGEPLTLCEVQVLSK